jgi:hypothetical protein
LQDEWCALFEAINLKGDPDGDKIQALRELSQRVAAEARRRPQERS